MREEALELAMYLASVKGRGAETCDSKDKTCRMAAMVSQDKTRITVRVRHKTTGDVQFYDFQVGVHVPRLVKRHRYTVGGFA